ncbi:MAG: fructosamine kinase family protein [Chitinophagaceae bacterium]|nr:fructosamine kinase family protein [Chitinophagaceae bacterium]
MFHSSFINHLQDRLSGFFSSTTIINNHTPVQGGDINQAFLLETNQGRFLIKINAAMYGLDLFEKEAKGLLQLADAKSLRVPMPLLDGKYHQQLFFVMEYIEQSKPSGNFWEILGEGMAKIHLNSNEHFGFAHNNFIGSLAQSNTVHTTWADFYAHERLIPLARKAHKRGVLESEYVEAIEKIGSSLSSIFPAEKPALLHGDLWSGNFMADEKGNPVIFDPAVYYGNREMDIAMSLLFGGFDDKFYASYHHHYPLQPGWESRIKLCQLYPLLVHLALFGGGYHEKVVEVIQHYI